MAKDGLETSAPGDGRAFVQPEQRAKTPPKSSSVAPAFKTPDPQPFNTMVLVYPTLVMVLVTGVAAFAGQLMLALAFDSLIGCSMLLYGMSHRNRLKKEKANKVDEIEKEASNEETLLSQLSRSLDSSYSSSSSSLPSPPQRRRLERTKTKGNLALSRMETSSEVSSNDHDSEESSYEQDAQADQLEVSFSVTDMGRGEGRSASLSSIGESGSHHHRLETSEKPPLSMRRRRAAPEASTSPSLSSDEITEDGETSKEQAKKKKKAKKVKKARRSTSSRYLNQVRQATLDDFKGLQTEQKAYKTKMGRQ